MPKREALKQEPSTGNVFADLGLADAGEHLIKAGLVVRIDRTIRQRKLTQAAAARLMGIDQPKVSAMLAGQFRGYSVERLMRFLVALGHDVEIVVKPRTRRTAGLRRRNQGRRGRQRSRPAAGRSRQTGAQRNRRLPQALFQSVAPAVGFCRRCFSDGGIDRHGPPLGFAPPNIGRVSSI